ncbi:unnamed protein product [Pedinophyceae sp. YPF-701]|nr:unnamed protein product [Pedinophyceae sp. YPF-701]
MTAREKYPGLPNLVMHEEDSQPPRPLKELPDWVEMEAAFMAAQDPLNPFNYFRFTGSDIGEPDEDLDDRAGDFEIRLPGNLRSEVSFEDMMAADAPRLRKILNIKSDPERRKQLKLFLKERLFIQPIPLTEPRAPRRQLKMVVLAQSMVTKVTKGGGVMRARVLVAVGDGCNRVGLAEAKANRMLSAVDKAYRAASRNLVRVPKFMLQTIREPVRAKQTASIVEMSPAYQDRGHRCSETIGMLCRLAGVNNVRAKVHRSQNRFNSAKAAFKCLQRLSDSFEQELKAYSPDRRAALLETAYNPEPAPNPRAPGGAGGDAESGQGLVGREDWSHMSEHLPGGAEGRAEPAERLASQLSA